jgi:hypothetical protein
MTTLESITYLWQWSYVAAPLFMLVALFAGMRLGWLVAQGVVAPFLRFLANLLTWTAEWVSALGIGFAVLFLAVRVAAVYLGGLDGPLAESLESGALEGIKYLDMLDQLAELAELEVEAEKPGAFPSGK